MHEIVNINDILCSKCFETLYSWVDILKSIRVYNDMYFTCKEHEENLFDKIVIVISSVKINK